MNIYKLADKITKRLIGFSVNFKYFEQTIKVNPYVHVKLSSSVSCSDGNDSYFRICFNPLDFIPTISFNIFDIKPRAKELGMKLKSIIDNGEIFINSYANVIRITVNVFKNDWEDYKENGSVTISIYIPPDSNRDKTKKYNDEDAKKVQDAFAKGALAVGGILLFKIIKGGIGSLLGGPVGAAVGFAT